MNIKYVLTEFSNYNSQNMDTSNMNVKSSIMIHEYGFTINAAFNQRLKLIRDYLRL